MWYGYPYEDHGDGQADERWRKTLQQQASQGGFPLARRIRTPIDRVLDPIEDVDALIADILTRGA